MLEVKVSKVRTTPHDPEQHKIIKLEGFEKLTPKIARHAAMKAFSTHDNVYVRDLDNRYGYRVYKDSTRKVKW